MKRFIIDENTRESIIKYMQSVPTGSISAGVPISIIQVLMNLEEAKDVSINKNVKKPDTI